MPHAVIAAVEFRAARPLFDIAPFFVCGQPQDDGRKVTLWARDAEGSLAMSMSASLA
jgi:3-methylfumaryl-CoA hydratase